MEPLKRISRHKIRAFTLVETMITLIISVALVMVSNVQLQNYQQQLVLNNTTRQVKTSIEQAARVSAIRHEAMTINYFVNSSLITFRGRHYSRDLYLDKNIEIYGLKDLTASQKGFIAPRTIKISDHKNSQKIKLQMMWGRAIDD
ncbi:conserved hypothetical protein [Lactobacillus acetotolerans]|jgi:competence protein ComGD|uniref:Prepilin-type N-terminal cleavage/methylation domain-containing protein n=2 Tax=Lactobacillus acetotolerans TaxID=1600 RepID=A0A0D6A445_9LACO|nr:Prepilin-type cleavage/methylation protein [Lactobacillus acetotolerans]BAQ57484.1 conserved hypothetical protein [Lactobacillus acetotolerans]